MTRRVIYQQLATVAQVGDPITMDRWFQPVVQPVLKAAIATAIVVSGCVLPPPQIAAAPTNTVDQWFRPLSEPTRKPVIHASLQRFSTRDFLFPAPETITLDKWFAPLAEPPRRPRLHAAFQPVTVGNLQIVAPEVLTLDKWFMPLSQRLYAKPGTPAHLQPVTFRGGLAPLQADILSTMWFNPLAEPVRPKAAIASAAQQTWSGVLKLIANPETVTMDKWFVALARPVLPPAPRFMSYQYVATIMVPASAWIRPGGLMGSMNASVTLMGDSGTGAIVLTGKYTR